MDIRDKVLGVLAWVVSGKLFTIGLFWHLACHPLTPNFELIQALSIFKFELFDLQLKRHDHIKYI